MNYYLMCHKGSYGLLYFIILYNVFGYTRAQQTLTAITRDNARSIDADQASYFGANNMRKSNGYRVAIVDVKNSFFET